MPIDREDFFVETDASDEVIATILYIKREAQKNPVEFYGKILTKNEQKWLTRYNRGSITHSFVESVLEFISFSLSSRLNPSLYLL